MGSEMILLDYYESVFGMRVRIALAEKGIKKYETREEPGLPEIKSPLLLQMNPVHKKIPVLIHNGKPISESLNIVQYIDEFWPDKNPIMPSDPYLRSHARFWGDYSDKTLFDIGVKVWASKGGEAQEEANKAFIEIYKVLEEELGDKPYFAGEEFGYVDLAIIPFSSWFYSYEAFGNIKIDTHFPNLVQWANRCLQRETVSENVVDPSEIYKFALKIRKKLGIDQ